MASGNLFVVSGPSGVGKGTLVARILERIPSSWVSVSATTRAPRPGEVDGVSYYFLSDEEFSKIVEDDGFLEWANVHVDRYGTPKASVEQHIKEGYQVILEIDVQGGLQVKEIMPETHLIFIEPPSMDVLRQRLIGRGTESLSVIEQRMKVAELEMQEKMKYDFVLVNDNLDTATEELVRYIESWMTDEKDD